MLAIRHSKTSGPVFVCLPRWVIRGVRLRASVRDRQEEQNEEDQTNHRDIRILTWKTLQSEGKNHGHLPATTFTVFVECLQEYCDLFRRLTRGLYSKTLILAPAQASRRRVSASLANLVTFKEFGS
jgi:hypothetical protein